MFQGNFKKYEKLLFEFVVSLFSNLIILTQPYIKARKYMLLSMFFVYFKLCPFMYFVSFNFLIYRLFCNVHNVAHVSLQLHVGLENIYADLSPMFFSAKTFKAVTDEK